MAVTQRIEELKAEALSAVAAADSTATLEDVRVRYLGRSAEITEIKRSIGTLDPDDRKKVGRAANVASREIEDALSSKTGELAAEEREQRLGEAVDVTLPGIPFPKGHLHPSMRVIDDVVDFFVGLGYRLAEGPEVETDYYNFTALNIPPEHPARSEHDTFFLDEGLILRTHTSPVQIRAMLSQEPPVYVVCPGTTYRRDSDPTHTPMFHQIEGLAVDRGLTLGHLKGTLAAMARHVFGEGLKVRLRPGYVPEEYTGFAFGMGPDRMAMVKYGIPDLRLFFEGDLRFLRQF